MDEYVQEMMKRIRIKSDTLKAEVESYIKAAMLDLKRSGANVTDADLVNPLVFNAAEFYCKWMMNFEGDGEKYEAAYNRASAALALSQKESYEN